MTDVYVALKRLRRTGKPARIVQPERTAPTFDETWKAVDRLALTFPDRVVTDGHGRR
jgi:hypothetical protein